MQFENYDVGQLCQNFVMKMADDGNTKATKQAKQVACEVLSRAGKRPEPGNSDGVENTLAHARPADWDMPRRSNEVERPAPVTTTQERAGDAQN